MTYADMLIRICAACILGGVVGAEREIEHKHAGLRTHILVSVTSALIMVVSEYLFFRYKGMANLDPARLGAQIVSGIGFLGAGAIMKDGNGVRGLTTASGLWAVAGIGIACGAGYYIVAAVVTGIMILVLVFFKRFDSFLSRRRQLWELTIRYDGQRRVLEEICHAITQNGNTINTMKAENDSDGAFYEVTFMLKSNFKNRREHLMSDILTIEGIHDVSIT